MLLSVLVGRIVKIILLVSIVRYWPNVSHLGQQLVVHLYLQAKLRHPHTVQCANEREPDDDDEYVL